MTLSTKNRAYDAARHQFQPGEKVLVDTNVWLYVHPPPSRVARPRWAKRYMPILNRLARHAVPIIDALVLSEYCNRYIRIEYGDSGFPGTFKAYRTSAVSQDARRRVVQQATRICQICTLADVTLAPLDLPEILQAVEDGTTDINDSLLLANCRHQGWKLLTHDADMTHGGIEVLTLNRHLLATPP